MLLECTSNKKYKNAIIKTIHNIDQEKKRKKKNLPLENKPDLSLTTQEQSSYSSALSRDNSRNKRLTMKGT